VILAAVGFLAAPMILSLRRPAARAQV